MGSVTSGGLLTYVTSEGDLLLFSKKSGRLYGFDKTAASVFRALESGEYTVVELLESMKDQSELKELVKSIARIMSGDEEPAIPSEDPLPDYPLFNRARFSNTPYLYRLGSCCFGVESSDTGIEGRLLHEIAHLTCRDSQDVSEQLRISVVTEGNNLWTIRFNGMAVVRKIEGLKLFPLFCDYIRIACYRQTDYLISLHSAVLFRDNRALILPAVSGSGKSTLAAYLMKRGFSFLTDEVALIDRQKRLLPLPFPLAIKEGSWRVLEREGIDLSTLPVHRRFDDQKLVFLPPSRMIEEPIPAEGALLIFPRYESGASTQLERLSILETLAMISESGYEVRNSFDEEIILEWIRLIESFKCYRLVYENLHEAEKTIMSLM